MTRVLVAWEDEKFDRLGELVSRVVHSSAPAHGVEHPRVVHDSAGTNGAFARYVGAAWPRARTLGVARDPKPFDHLICVVDADRLHDLIPASIKKAPNDATGVAAWHADATEKWTAWLRSKSDAAGPDPKTVHGVVLRWSKESLVLAGYDQPAAAVHLEIDVAHSDVAAALRTQCNVHPSTIEDRLFTDTFRQPRHCVDLLRVARKLRKLPKSAQPFDDALKALAKESLAIVRTRVPDIDQLARLIWSLHA